MSVDCSSSSKGASRSFQHRNSAFEYNTIFYIYPNRFLLFEGYQSLSATRFRYSKLFLVASTENVLKLIFSWLQPLWSVSLTCIEPYQCLDKDWISNMDNANIHLFSGMKHYWYSHGVLLPRRDSVRFLKLESVLSVMKSQEDI